MATLALSGDTGTRVGSVDPNTWQLFSGNNPILLSSFTNIKILFTSSTDGSVKEFTLLEDPTQVIIIPDATIFDEGVEGEALQFIPLATDFPLVDRFTFYIDLIDASGGSHPVPYDDEYIFDVRFKSTPS
jgi:hypothetical protein